MRNLGEIIEARTEKGRFLARFHKLYCVSFAKQPYYKFEHLSYRKFESFPRFQFGLSMS